MRELLKSFNKHCEKQGVHVIFQTRGFTGDIVKYDQERRQLIEKNFKKSISTIIRISEIQKISLVPNNIRIAQQKERFNPSFILKTNVILAFVFITLISFLNLLEYQKILSNFNFNF